ncbi:MAG TPA: M48 family metallopeptidase [Prolixibacteraceae bacterium]|nr:M48 family metallopeptidase [Prolixibacteraceae bacterium]HOS00433.1 M48 family metallopeptidase [Prolixibacteraceae bacterium]HOS90164.1 M48 family metallopeptidase [Prolixibacteraceae bacterium]HPL45873.1 M48 family metallopeptidase [Prolixibacteraceae bacterium]HQE52220.1 M48 family metallopeptidase [Prolixibacteraceae bacterium]
MKYVGIKSQIRKNNINSVIMLIAFPVLLVAMVYVFVWFTSPDEYRGMAADTTAGIVPLVLAGTGIWFLIAWFSHTAIIQRATGSKPLERRENKRVFNLVENLCISMGMQAPKVFVIEDDSLNAFASGISDKTYAISLSRGIINKLEDDELEGVIAHELTHIRNRDVRLLIVAVIFVGIFSFIANMAFRGLRFGSFGNREKNNAPVVLVALVISGIAYLVSLVLRFGISRSREYMADAGSAEMTRKPYALASALRKISGDPLIEAVKSRDVSQMFIDNPRLVNKEFSIDRIFATHPPIEKRIQLLEQFV